MIKPIIRTLFFVLATTAVNAVERSKPYELPTFEKNADYKNKIPALIKTQPINTEALFKKTLDCYPAKSKFKIDVAVRGVIKNTQGYDLENNSLGKNYAMITATMPIYSSTEIDRQRDREFRRRQDTAKSVTDFAQAIERKNYKQRLIVLYESLEHRSSVRVMSGITGLEEQVSFLEKVAKTHTELLDANATLTEARLKLMSVCADKHMTEFNTHLENLISAATVPTKEN